MTAITFKGQTIHTAGFLPLIGKQAPNFTLTQTDLSDIKLTDFAGKKIILNIFPSVDTEVCAAAERRFNEIANELKNVVILCISADSPFAQKRFCAAENLKNVIPLSIFRHPQFGTQYGVLIQDGPLAGFLARAVVVLDEKAKVIYTQQVAEVSHEPDYQAVLDVFN